MKKNYSKTLVAVLMLSISGEILRAQCTAPTPPTVSGTTLAGCTSSSAFTLTGTGTGTNPLGWYANPFGGNALTTNNVFTTPTLTSGATYYVGQSTTQPGVDTLALPAHLNNVAAMETRGFYFTAPVDFIITGLRVPVAIGGTISGIAVMKFPAVPPLYTNVTNTFNTLFLDQAITGTNVVAVNIPVYTGDIIGILSERADYSSYGPTTNPFTSTLGIGSTTLNLYRMGMLFNLATTAPQDLWTETVNSIGRVEMYVKSPCNSTLTPVTVSVVGIPQVTVSPPPFVCANSSYTLTAGGATTYTWSGGPQTSSYVVNPSTTTTYSVMGSILSTCNSSLSTITISVEPSIPTVLASSSSPSVCSGNTLTLNGTGAPTFTWAGGANSVTNGIVFVPLGTQQYTLYGSNSCGTGSTTITVPVSPTPTLITSASSAGVCDGKSATLTVSGASTYSWTDATAPGATFVVTPTVTTAYNVSGVSSAGCISSGVQVVLVYPNPTVTAITNKTLVCSAGPATVTASGADTYSWSSGPTSSLTVVNPMVSTIYTVTGTYSMTGCSSENTVNVNVFLPNLTISNSSTVCYGTALTLTANVGSGTSTYTWSNGPIFNSSNVTATVSAVYTVTARTSTGTVSNCISTATVAVDVNPLPTVSVSATRTTICKGEKLVLTAAGGTSYTWVNLAPTTKTIQVSPSVVNSTTSYTATGTDANGCVNSGTIGVKVNACTGIAELEKTEDLVSIYPNPNNGNFVIRVKVQTRLVLVNELGQSIRELHFDESNNYQQDVRDLSNGIYFIKGFMNGSSIQDKIIVHK